MSASMIKKYKNVYLSSSIYNEYSYFTPSLSSFQPKTSINGHSPSPKTTTTSGFVLLTSSRFPHPSPGRRSTLLVGCPLRVFQYAVATRELFGDIVLRGMCQQFFGLCRMPSSLRVSSSLIPYRRGTSSMALSLHIDFTPYCMQTHKTMNIK